MRDVLGTCNVAYLSRSSRQFLSSFWFCYVGTNILRMPIKRTALAMAHRKSSLSSAIPAL
jgi:hypothetical protein